MDKTTRQGLRNLDAVGPRPRRGHVGTRDPKKERVEFHTCAPKKGACTGPFCEPGMCMCTPYCRDCGREMW